MKKICKTFLTPVFTLLLFSGMVTNVRAADATLEFKHRSFEDGYIVTDIYLDTGGFKVNGVTADFSYTSDVIEAVEIDILESPFDNYVEKDISENGMVYISCFSIDGVQGEGVVATIIFKSKAVGKATLEFTDDAVVLDAVNTTNILSDSEEAVYTVDEDFTVLPETGTTENIALGLLLVTLLVMIIALAFAGFTMWGGIYFSLGKWKVGGKYEVGLKKKKSGKKKKAKTANVKAKKKRSRKKVKK